MKKLRISLLISSLSILFCSCTSGTFGSSSCTRHEDCETGVCEDGRCVEPAKDCTSDDDCISPLSCVDESCILKKGKCLKDSDCDSTQHCVDHNCEARAQGCKSNEGCEGELVCVQSACVEKSPKTSDADGDTISDFYEGRAEMIDTDGDTTPDYLDTDSDNDTVLDSIEYGSDSLGYEPHDSDGDGIYDFRDDDSNHNGIADAVECKKITMVHSPITMGTAFSIAMTWIMTMTAPMTSKKSRV